MKNARQTIIALFMLFICSVILQSSSYAQDNGFVSIFDGKTMKQWRMNKGQEGHWRAVNGILEYDGKSEAKKRQDKDLYSINWYNNFVFIFDWRFPATPREYNARITLPDGGFAKNPDGSFKREKRMSAGDSGVFLRGWSKLQVNLWCNPMGSGQLYGFMHDFSMPVEKRRACAPSRNTDNPPGEWNTMKITLIDNDITIEQNGVIVIDNLKLYGLPYGGPIALQHHGDAIQFRNLRIKEL